MRANMPLLYTNHKKAYFLLSNPVIFTDFIVTSKDGPKTNSSRAMFLASPVPS